METATQQPISVEVMADLEAVLDAAAAGKPVDAEVARRVQERSARARAEVVQRCGVQDIGVAIIRALRDGA